MFPVGTGPLPGMHFDAVDMKRLGRGGSRLPLWLAQGAASSPCLASPGQQDAEEQRGQGAEPVSAPNTASPAVLRARACSAAVIPETATVTSFTISVVS